MSLTRQEKLLLAAIADSMSQAGAPGMIPRILLGYARECGVPEAACKMAGDANDTGMLVLGIARMMPPQDVVTFEIRADQHPRVGSTLASYMAEGGQVVETRARVTSVVEASAVGMVTVTAVPIAGEN